MLFPAFDKLNLGKVKLENLEKIFISGSEREYTVVVMWEFLKVFFKKSQDFEGQVRGVWKRKKAMY